MFTNMEDIQSEKELIQSLDKADKTAIISFFKEYKIGELPESKNKPVEVQDEFLVDLQNVSTKVLAHLHLQSSWVAPSYFLRFRLNDVSVLDDEDLLTLVQTKSKVAIDELFKRYSKNLEEASDEALVLFAQNDNDFASEVLIKRFIPFVKKITRRLERKFYFRGYDSNDLFQEGVMGLFKAIEDFKVERKTRFKDFSKHVIEKHIGTLILRSDNYKNRALNQSFSYHTPIGTDSEITFEQLLKSESFLPEDTTVKKETFYAIWNSLTELEQKVLTLYAKGLSYEEIGEQVSKKKKAIDNTIQRIRKKGKQYIETNLNK